MTIVAHEDLPVGMQERQKLAHRIAESSMIQVWNIAIEQLSNLNTAVTGNDALAYFGTLIGAFTARWLIEMTKIADRDDAGVLKEDLIKKTLNGVIAMLGAKGTFEEEKELPDGIKRLKK